MKRPALIGAATSVLIAGALTTQPTMTHAVAEGSSCTPRTVTLPDLGYGGAATAFNATTVVGSVTKANGDPLAAFWRRGHVHVIRRFHQSYIYDINRRGEMVGTANGFSTAWVRSPSGHITILKNAPGSSGKDSIAARRINRAGAVAGADAGQNSAARWDAPRARPVQLRPASGDDASYAKGINDRDQVAGDTDKFSQRFGIVPRAAIWSRNGHIRVLTGLFDHDVTNPQNAASELFVINNRGQSVGDSLEALPNGSFRDEATLWSRRGHPRGLGYLHGDTTSVALALSSNGYVGGVSTTSDAVDHAFVWPGHGPLLALRTPGVPYRHSTSDVHQIARSGKAVGSAGPVGGLREATEWTCVFDQAFRPGRTLPRSARGDARAVLGRWR